MQMKLTSHVLGNETTQFCRFNVLVKELIQLLPRDPDHAAGHCGLDGNLRRKSTKTGWIITYEFILK